MKTYLTRAAALAAAIAVACSIPALGQAAPQQHDTAVAPTDEAVVPSDVDPLFVGGEPATVEEFPFVIAGLREGGSRPEGQSCTGSVVAPTKILTAAHCADSAGRKTFLHGLDDLNEGEGFTTEVVDYRQHPSYVNFDEGYDVAVVTTADEIPVPDGEYAEFATSADEGLSEPGQDGHGLGYGMKDRDDNSQDVTLQQITLPIVDGEQECQGVGAGFDKATMLCAGFEDGRKTILQGDSGGPLSVDGKIVGVASWSRSDFQWYSVYGRLDNEMGDWVQEQVES